MSRAPLDPKRHPKRAAMVEKLLEVIDDGLEFGHCKVVLRISMNSQDWREVHIEAGLDRRYMIPPDEIKS